MTKQHLPSIYLFVALACEAKPLVHFFGLKKQPLNCPFAIYKNDDIVLVVAGVGKIAMAGSVAYTMAIFSNVQVPILINIGIAGHQSQALGNLCVASKIIDVETGKCFYPQLIGNNWPESFQIKTFSIPCAQYNENCLNDMEASAFCEMAIKFSSSELIHSLKIVSDNETSSIDNINAKLVAEWITKQLTDIEMVLKKSSLLRKPFVTIELNELTEIVNNWHFTVTGQIKLKALLMRWRVLTSQPWKGFYAKDLSNGKVLLQRLEKDINQLELKL
ncbi:MAG: hypothetical protein KAT04_00800 [Methylococcales bacterium]|nr:hypothetical protein [Methylococcales bacterium]